MPEHACPSNPHLPCYVCSGPPVCDCPPGRCPEDVGGPDYEEG